MTDRNGPAGSTVSFVTQRAGSEININYCDDLELLFDTCKTTFRAKQSDLQFIQ